LSVTTTQGTLPPGYRWEAHSKLASTNDEAMSRARAGDPGNLWITADEQSAGRGRLGRAWVSRRGNLFASLLLIDPCPMQAAPKLGFVAGLAVANALSIFLGTRVKLKWPNDAVIDGAKLSGLLLEATQINGRLACVIGIGVNCAHHPDDLPYAATDLATLGVHASAQQVFVTLAQELALALSRFDEGRGFAQVRQDWLAHAAGLGDTRQGLFKGLDDEGRLLLQTAQGLDVIEAGDVFLGQSARNLQDH
jgi:BirA family biotin operon repressor/biotin-[acetyl-CoA-carboxylase] ligase